jgi:Protein of unknown function (DUF3293)
VSNRWDAYVSAELRIQTPDGPVHVYPAPALQATGEYPDRDRRPIAVITAHNPGGADADPGANVAAQHALVAELDRRGLSWWPAAGADPSWTHVEESVAVPGLSQPDALELGAKFAQEAIFLLSPTGLRVIDCATGRMSMTGWHIEPDDPDHDHEADDYADDYDEEDDDHGIEVTVYAPPAARDGMPGLVLADSRWADDTGAEYLLRIGESYAIYQTNGDETEIDDLDADSDETAITAFREFLGVPG